jgi:hypothetical protein
VRLPRPLRTALDQLDAAIQKRQEEAALAWDLDAKIAQLTVPAVFMDIPAHSIATLPRP